MNATRWKIVATAAVACVMLTVTVVWAVHRRAPAVEVDPALTLAGPGLLIRDTTTGHLAVIDATGRRRQSPVECARAYAAAGTVLCLQKDPTLASSYQLSVLDREFRSERVVPLNGIPTRTRVSADGRMLGFTVFVSGDSYLSSGFSTRSGVLDRATGVLATSLEDFRVDGKRPPADANFWGVSVAADDNTFYATMSTGPHFYLVRGDFAAETITVLDDGIECPSLSPDGSRLVYKKRLPDATWQLWVYRLETRERTRLAEPENVDDQAAWRDDTTVMYSKIDQTNGQVNVWSVPADGLGTPVQVAADAESPAVLG